MMEPSPWIRLILVIALHLYTTHCINWACRFSNTDSIPAGLPSICDTGVQLERHTIVNFTRATLEHLPVATTKLVVYMGHIERFEDDAFDGLAISEIQMETNHINELPDFQVFQRPFCLFAIRDSDGD